MTALEHEILRHWSLYLDGRPEISDAAFDALVEQLRRLDSTSSVLSFLGHAGSSPHEKPMRSLQKVKSEEAVNKWVSAIKTTDLRVMPKFDGLAVSLKYVQGTLVRATTRGDGRFGEDITRHIVRLPSVPRKVSNLTGEVRGEIVLRRSRLADLGGATCRNVAVGLIGRDETSQSHMLDFIPWGVVGGAFRTFDETIAWLHSQYPNQAPCIPYTYDAAVQLITEPGDVDRDGAVIVVNDFALRERLGETDHHPRWAVALKLATESQNTTVRKLEWQVGRTGVVTPVVVIDEVEVDGVNITRVTGHNAQTIVEKGIGPGAIVSITRRGGVIPHIEDVTLKAAVRIPTTCGECGGALKFTGRTLTHEGCPAAQRAALEFFLKTIGVEGFGDITLRALGATDLLSIRGSDVPEHLREACRKVRSVSLATAFEAVGLPLARKLAESVPTWRHLILTSDEDLLDIEGLGPSHLKKIREIDLTLLEQLEEVGVHIESPPAKPTEGPLLGEVICFTGELRTLGRDAAQALARQKGAIVTSSVTRATTLLVAAGESGSSKYKKAQERNVPIIDEDAFLARIGPITAPKNVVEFGRVSND